MHLFVYFALFSIFLCSCNSKAHVPHYILTESQESKKEVYKYNYEEEEPTFNN